MNKLFLKSSYSEIFPNCNLEIKDIHQNIFLSKYTEIYPVLHTCNITHLFLLYTNVIIADSLSSRMTSLCTFEYAYRCKKMFCCQYLESFIYSIWCSTNIIHLFWRSWIWKKTAHEIKNFQLKLGLKKSFTTFNNKI